MLLQPSLAPRSACLLSSPSKPNPAGRRHNCGTAILIKMLHCTFKSWMQTLKGGRHKPKPGLHAASVSFASFCSRMEYFPGFTEITWRCLQLHQKHALQADNAMTYLLQYIMQINTSNSVTFGTCRLSQWLCRSGASQSDCHPTALALALPLELT